MRRKDFNLGRHSWLQWPVKIKGYEGEDENELHVTARFLGVENTKPEAVSNLIVGMGISFKWGATLFIWEPALWGGHHVLVLKECPYAFWQVHHRTRTLYEANRSYVPHVTVSEKYWKRVCSENITAAQVLTVEPMLQLFIKGVEVHRWAHL